MHTNTPEHSQDFTASIHDRQAARYAARERVLTFILTDPFDPCRCVSCRVKRLLLKLPQQLAERHAGPDSPSLPHALVAEIVSLMVTMMDDTVTDSKVHCRHSGVDPLPF